MANQLPSAGKLTLAAKCIGSVILPQVVEEIGEAGEKGKEQHAKLEKFFKGSRKEPEGSTDEDRDLFARCVSTVCEVDSDSEWSELGFAVDAIRDDARPWNRDADDCDRSRYFVGIADLVQRTGESSFAAWDWKSGSYVATPEWNWQLLLAGLYLFCLSARSPSFSCSLGIVYIGQPTDDGKFKSDVNTFDAAFFESKLKALGSIQRLLESADPETVKLYEGKHCQFCPARARCPAKVGALGLALMDLDHGELTDKWMLRHFFAIRDNAFSQNKTAYEILERNGNVLDLGDGREAVLTKSNGRRKVFTRRSSEKQQAGSDAPEDGESGAEGGGDSST